VPIPCEWYLITISLDLLLALLLADAMGVVATVGMASPRDRHEMSRRVMDPSSPIRGATPEEEEIEEGRDGTDRQLLSNAIQTVVNALGGVVDGDYVLGDSCLGCLKDLKKIWRLDDHDDDRTVARVLWETGVFVNDLVPILLQAEGKVGLACADIMTAMTWPIDLTEELKELEEVEELERTDYTVLLNSHAAYKRALVNNPKAFDALLNILLPSLAKTGKEKQPRDNQIISLVLHLLRNLAFIKSDQSEYITTLSSSHFLDLLLTLGSNAFHNNLLLDFFHLLFRGIPLSSLSSAQKATRSALTKALEAEQAEARKNSRHANTRHNRFGTTVAIRQHNASFIIHKQSAITRDPGELLDASKKATRRKAMKTDETYEALTYEAVNVMKKFCNTFIESCFNRESSPFLPR
jgi:replication fork protection complex subunit Tof1/Swi1